MNGFVVKDMEKATHLIEAMPFRYFKVSYAGMGEEEGTDLVKVCRLMRQTVLDDKGKRVVKWIPGPDGQLWVTPEIAKRLCSVSDADAKMRVVPMARLVKVGRDDETDEVEVAETTETTDAPEAPVRRRTKEQTA